MRPGRRARWALTWHGLGIVLRRLLLTQGDILKNGPVDVVAMCCVIRDPDRTQLERAEAVEKLVLTTGLRSLRDTLAVVYGLPDDPGYVGPTTDAFDIVSDAFGAVSAVTRT